MVNKWLKIIHQIAARVELFPCHCLLCLRPARRNIALCRGCEAYLPWLKAKDQVTSLPLLGYTSINSFQALFDYASPINKFIAKFKYAGDLHFAKLLGTLMAENLRLTHPIDSLLFMPLHPLRQRIRGFNQTLELAKVIATLRGFPLDKWSCKRVKDTSTQSSLSRKGRLHNLSPRAFSINAGFKAKHVLVIEDIVTTGVTISSFCQSLKAQGVETIQVWSCCRTAL